VIHGGMSCDPIKGQGQGCLKIETKSTSSAGMYAVKKLTVNCDIMILQDNIEILSQQIIQHHVTFKLPPSCTVLSIVK